MKLLFELFTEELPTSEMVGLDEQVRYNLTKLLESHNIEYDEPTVYITPRRIAIKTELSEHAKPQEKKIIGPPESVCYKDGKPTKALEGFVRKNGVSIDDVKIEKTPKGRYAVITLKSEAIAVKPLLNEIFQNMLNSLHFNKKMRWGSGEYEFIRPVHSIVFLVDNEVVPFSFSGVESSKSTYGHRFMHKGAIDVTYDTYEQSLKNAFVIVDQREREKKIIQQLEGICKEQGMELIEDEELLEEIVNLTEYPVVVIGSFDERFLKLPKEVLITSMKDHQRYFGFIKDGKLLNKFAAVSNIETENMEIIKQGYERVLKARFADAEFFFEEDKKRKLDSFVDELKNMMFQEGLGSQYDRTLRLIDLSGYIADQLGFDKSKAERAAYLSKADLMTQMVYEFPELQGVMGREYALLSGEDKEVTQAIYEQYLPKGDEIPSSRAGIALSIADKIDLIVGGFMVGLKPTGAKDPYGLRRAALGVIRTLIENRLFLSLKELLLFASRLYSQNPPVEDIIEFFRIRFKNHLSNSSTDTLEAVTNARFDDIYDAFLRVEALEKFIDDDKDKSGRFAIKRVFNIVKDFDGEIVDPSLLKEDEEKMLYGEIEKIKTKAEELLKERNYYGLLKSVVNIKPAIDEFFDHVMVMDKDELLRKNRLSLLNRLKKTVLHVADFKYLEI